MTAVLPLRSARVTWARVDRGFHVASRDGEYIGSAERTADGHYVGLDGRSTPVGRYESLAEAQRAVEAAPAEVVRALPPRVEAAFQVAATVAGVVAIGTLAAAASLPGL